MHIILHLGLISIDLHLLNIMNISGLVLLICIWLPGVGPLSLIKAISTVTFRSLHLLALIFGARLPEILSFDLFGWLVFVQKKINESL